MNKLDPIIAVKDVEISSQWYQTVFGFKSAHGGSEFDILTDENGEVIVCLHKWGEHDHPTMKDSSITPGNGLILYFRTKNMEEIRQIISEINYPVESEINLSPNSGKKEFSLRDPDGYCWIVSEFHEYGG